MRNFPRRPNDAWTTLDDDVKQRLIEGQNQMNLEAVDLISADASHEVHHERALIEHFQTKDINNTLFFCTLQRHIIKYRKQDHEASKKQVCYNHQVKAWILHDSKK